MHNGDTGAAVATLQRQLNDAGFKLTVDGWFGESTELALIAFQRRASLVADGIAGPKTIAALTSRNRDPRLLSDYDLEAAAVRLGIPVAAVKAVNLVESRGHGFVDNGKPAILYERHVAHRLLAETSPVDADRAARRYPNLINKARGGYSGGSAEWSRLTSARQIIDPAIADASCSWGQYQVMGYHWQRLGYASIEQFVAAMHRSEADQLDAFCRYIEADPAIHKALKSKKWATFASLYNGPAYKDNLYDVKLARAFERFTPPEQAAA